MSMPETLPDYRVIATPAEEPSRKVRQWRRILSHTGLLIGAGLLTFILLVAIFAPLLAPYDPYVQDLMNRRVPPVWHAWFYDHPKASWAHPLGTDPLGRDYLSRLIYGARISLLIGGISMLISGVIGTVMGVTAGYYGGRIDMVVNFLITTRLSMPLILVALAIISLYGGSITTIIWVLGLLLWDRFAVVMRSATMQVRDADYVTVAKVVGCSGPFIIFREILPNILSALIVVATFEMALAILLEATLSFLGLGVQPPEPSWGLMLSEAKRDIFFDPWMIMIPGAAIFLLVFAINVLGDGVRDIAAPEGRS